MVRCDTPTCDVPINGYPTGRNVEEVVNEWNERQCKMDGEQNETD